MFLCFNLEIRIEGTFKLAKLRFGVILLLVLEFGPTEHECTKEQTLVR
jgi:hypothetical protein